MSSNEVESVADEKGYHHDVFRFGQLITSLDARFLLHENCVHTGIFAVGPNAIRLIFNCLSRILVVARAVSGDE